MIVTFRKFSSISEHFYDDAGLKIALLVLILWLKKLKLKLIYKAFVLDKGTREG